MNLPKTYEPGNYEPNIYALWETSGAFTPSGQGEPYCIVMPPPNANGNLHIGHALMAAVEDILIRYYRMRGRDTIYIPGADHAGFETWVVFERSLEAEGKSRFDYSREELYSMVWKFVEQQRGNMELQLRALGTSCDWNSLVFTLDKKVIDTTYATFRKLWNDDLIYRGERIVNYCTRHQTSFADIEVVYEEEQGKLYYVAYPLVGQAGEIIVATTRPETMLGDVAIAVNPDDERYKDLIGKKATLSVTGKEIPIIGDNDVDASFGTGAVKITPAHDPLDFEIGERHNLPIIQVIGFDGTMTAEAPTEYVGLDVNEARAKVLDKLEKLGTLRKIEDYTHKVPHCYKCDCVIQPLVKDQWFLKVRPLAERAKQVLQNGDIKFTPKNKADELIKYFDDLRDWNLSRQIPWGIPIPAFQNVDNHDDWIFDDRVDQVTIEIDGKVYRREDDTFDTWFSSGQWPFIVTDFGQGGELAKFYPTNVLETASDILRAWVARMIMLGLYVTDKVPFCDVYLHGLVQDEKGQKMSKSRGNVINPMEFIEQYGSDALRLGLIANRSAAQPQAFSPSTVVAGRNFCNKLWNIARFIQDRTEEAHIEASPETLADHWVLRQLDNARKSLDDMIAKYRFAEANDVVYHTIWDDVADWYIEASKTGASDGMLRHVLEICLKLAHPFAPFVTETIWTTMHADDSMLIAQQWPNKIHFDEDKAGQFDQIRDLVTETRYLTIELPGKKQTMIYTDDQLIADNADLIKSLAKLGEVKKVDQSRGLRIANSNHAVWLDVDRETLYDHQTKLELRLVEVRQQIENLEKRLANRGYTDNAPTELVEESKNDLATKKALQQRLVKELEIANN